MKKKLKVSLYLFIFTTLFFVAISTYVFAGNAEQSVLNAITTNLKMERIETEIRRTDGTPLNTEYRIYLNNSSMNISSDGDITVNGRLLGLRMSYVDRNGYTQYISGNVSSDGSNSFFRTNSPLDSNINYSIELVDDSGNVVATKSGIFYKNETVKIEETADGTSLLGAVVDSLVFDFRKMGRLLVETFCRLITPAGDAFVDMISAAIGEVATIDGAVYNRIKKVDIDFFTKDSKQYYNSDGTVKAGVTPPLRITMSDVVNTMYGMFRGIAVVVLLVMLVYIGIKIMLTSTAIKKASYKSVFLAWVMGVSMLMFFPYVMKYTIQLNNALCTWIGGETNTTVNSNDIKQYQISPTLYGSNEFIDKVLRPGETLSQNAMMYVRYYGANFYNVPLLIVYFIMIGQLLAILIMYYKRVFMLAFLISIFPLVAMIYPLNKIGDVKMNPFGTWFKEFAVNVFVQSFHAATYRVIVTLGVNSYQQNGNWLFMIMCILFLFEGEKIVRAIFNAKSSMNSIGDMAMAGAMAMSIMQKAGGLLPDFGKNKQEGDNDDEMDAMKKAKADRITATSRRTPGAESNLSAASRMSAGDGDSSSSSSESSDGELADSGAQFDSTPMDTGTSDSSGASSSKTQLGRNVGADTSTPFSTTESQIEGVKSERGIGKHGNRIAKVAGTAFSATSQLTGATMGMTYGLAQSDAQTAAAGLATGASAGAKVGKAGKSLLEGAVDKYADIQAARVLAGEYENEEHDEEIGIKSDMSEEKKKAIREAYAKLAKRTGGIGSKEGAQLKFIKERIDIEEKHKS